MTDFVTFRRCFLAVLVIVGIGWIASNPNLVTNSNIKEEPSTLPIVDDRTDPAQYMAALHAQQDAGGSDYWIQTNSQGNLVGRNQSNQFETIFTQNKINIVGKESLTLSLVKIGRSLNLYKVDKAVHIHADKNRVEFNRGNVVEWYVNGPLGLEQGFILTEPPKGAGEQVVLALNVTGELKPQLSSFGSQVLFKDTHENTKYRYDKLVAFDSRGRTLPAHMEIANNLLHLVVDDEHAIYPVTIDPLVTQEIKLTASDAAANDWFGWRVALWEDTAIVGSLADDDGADGSGSAYVFVQSGTTWTQQQKLAASDVTAWAYFGRSVAIWEDTAVVGADGADGMVSGSGAAYAFVRTGNSWSQQQKLMASDGGGSDDFGYSIALSGNTAIVGARYDDDLGINSGAVYVFTRSGSTWTQQQKLTASDGTDGDRFGHTIALYGSTALIGAIGNSDAGAYSGSAYIFVRSGSTWIEEAKLTASDAAAWDYFGGSVALWEDTAVIGAYADDDDGDASGSAYIFTRAGTTWYETDKLLPADLAANDEFGIGAAIYEDTVVIGSHWDDDGASNAGSAYVFERENGIWTEHQKLLASSPTTSDFFGEALAVYGNTIAAGVYADDDYGNSSGAVYLFSPDQDFDGVFDWSDNCPNVSNGGQEDQDGDGEGDICDLDVDGDGIVNGADNCTLVVNISQQDTDGDGFGDACDTINDNDVDGDTVLNTSDNCPFVANTNQADVDGDGLGDLCDDSNGLDVDGDTVTNTNDNCPFVANADQADADSDGLGDLCDDADGLDVDGDTVLNASDNCPFVANTDQADGDGDGLGDLCDDADGLDVDEDGVANADDNCPFVGNGDQTDTDGDGLGDLCDDVNGLDVDGDTVLNTSDNCPFVSNEDQADQDGDGLGDPCDGFNDLDADSDSVLNTSDNCPFVSNEDQADQDGDGLGDLCDETNSLDLDDDGVANTDDNCPFAANEDQTDVDDDGLGDLCDDANGLDVDGDGVANTDDNCPFVANNDQADDDGDGLGDLCDDADGLDVDGDGVANTDDNCPFVANDNQADGDDDGLGDLCDDADGLDLDGDGIANTIDNCPFVANEDQADNDSDGLGDLCDDADGLDLDGDGVLNTNDNCPLVANDDQVDIDGDGLGNACDDTNGHDLDGDGLSNGEDNCPFITNEDQADVDQDGIGDVCDSINNLEAEEDSGGGNNSSCHVITPGKQTVNATPLVELFLELII